MVFRIAQLHDLLGPEVTYLCQQGPPMGMASGNMAPPTPSSTSPGSHCCSPFWQGLVNVLIEHQPTIGDIITNKYLKVMFKIPKTGHLPTPFWIRCSYSCWASGMDSDISHSALIWRCTQCIKVTLSCWLMEQLKLQLAELLLQKQHSTLIQRRSMLVMVPLRQQEELVARITDFCWALAGIPSGELTVCNWKWPLK